MTRPAWICEKCWTEGWVSSNSSCEQCAELLRHQPTYLVQVNTGNGWRKVRDIEPTHLATRAARTAAQRADMPRRSSSSEGYPHRVVEVAPDGTRTVADLSPIEFPTVKLRGRDVGCGGCREGEPCCDAGVENGVAPDCGHGYIGGHDCPECAAIQSGRKTCRLCGRIQAKGYPHDRCPEGKCR